ncbi:hypothetical protein [Flavobacterium sp. ZB4P13]|uniref:hypothetical protein n=1 Tax=Flavobacterium sp. ZB4P13 TaxID=3401728 RepID=UPI003AABD0B7
MLLVFGQASLYGQAVSGAAVKANFGIDADVYANRLQFGGLTTAHTDDWFLNADLWPGTGENDIRQDSVQYFIDKIVNPINEKINIYFPPRPEASGPLICAKFFNF